ncbi:hypothetical protein YC2023_121761 [Brassica napus]
MVESLGVLNMLFQGGIYQQMLSHKVSRAFQSQYHSKLSLIYWKLELSLPPAVGRRVCVRAAAGVLSSSRINRQSLSPPFLFRFPPFGALVSHQPPWLRFWSHDAVCGKDGGLSCAFLVSGSRRLTQIRRRRSLHPWRGSFLSSAVFGSSSRGVKAITASRRRILSPSLLGSGLFSFCFSHRLVLAFVCARVGGERSSPVETVISPWRSIPSVFRGPKMLAVRFGGAAELRSGREIRRMDLRRR